MPASATGTFGLRTGIVIEPGMGYKIGTDVTYTQDSFDLLPFSDKEKYRLHKKKQKSLYRLNATYNSLHDFGIESGYNETKDLGFPTWYVNV